MKRRTLGLAMAAATITGLSLTNNALAQTDDTAAVAAQLEKLRQAMLTRDKAALESLMADELTYGHSDRRVMNKTEIIDAISTGKSQFSTITISDQTIRIVGDLAIVRHRFEADAVSNGKPGHPDIRIIEVWQKRPGGWQMLVRQAH